MAGAVAALSACAADSPAMDRRTSDIRLPAEFTTIEDRLPERATLDSVLRGHHVGAEVVTRVIDVAQRAFNLRSLRAGQPYRLALTLDGAFRSFEYAIDRDRVLRIAGPATAEPGTLTADVVELPTDTTTAAISGVIDADHPSLIAAVTRAGEALELALQLADVFGGQIDFNSDLQPGDRFEMLFEKEFRDGEFVGYGEIVAARFANDDRRLQAFRFVQEDGQAAYFDETGQSVRGFFLPSPLPFDPRVTSRFSRRRAHPVDGIPRAHLGVDYAATVGTPVLATAHGVVVSTGFSGASGRLIRLRHTNGYETYYLHLSAFARGIRPGARVSQGDVIGRVGASGVVTGPHLDYRVSRNGVFVDPLLERRRQPATTAVAAESLTAFEAVRDQGLTHLSERINVADVLVRGEVEHLDNP